MESLFFFFQWQETNKTSDPRLDLWFAVSKTKDNLAPQTETNFYLILGVFSVLLR